MGTLKFGLTLIAIAFLASVVKSGNINNRIDSTIKSTQIEQQQEK